MTTPRRSLATLLVAASLALTAAGCGVKASSDGAAVSTDPQVTTTTDAPDDTTASTQPDTTVTGDTTDTTEPATTETTRPSSSTLPGGFNAQVKEQIVLGFKSLGLNDKKANCLADAYLKEFGTTASSNPDYSKILDLFSACDIDPSEIGAGG